MTPGGPSLTLSQKESYLLSLSEDDFRDKVVRPLLERLGFKSLRDTCGADEEGKDAIFSYPGPLGDLQIYALQTKKGRITMSRSENDNVVTALTQVSTMLETTITLTNPHTKRKPNVALLCASGKINNSAREHIFEKTKDPRVQIWDGNDVIDKIDAHYSEFWWGIDESTFPYLRSLQDQLLGATDYIWADDDQRNAPITDESYVPIYLTRIDAKVVRFHGKSTVQPEIIELTATSVLQRNERLIVLFGGPGSGKTTILRRIAYSAIKDAISKNSRAQIPVLLKAQDLLGHATVEQAIVAAVKALTPSSNVPFSESELRAGTVLLLLDALDETSGEERVDALAKLKAFVESNKACRIICTSRDYSSIRADEFLKTFYQYSVIDLALADAQKIVDRSLKGGQIPKNSMKEVVRRLQNVHGLRLSPLLVTVFVAGSDFTQSDIPPNITEVFKKYAEMMLGRWDQKKGLRQQHESQRKDHVVQQLALRMHADRVTHVKIDTARRIFHEVLLKLERAHLADSMFDEIVYRSGLMHVEDDSLSFNHHLLQEFFAGRAITDDQFFENVVHDDWWRIPTLFYFGEHPRLGDHLLSLAKHSESLELPELFEAGVTIGLAAQACHLTETAVREEIAYWVVNALAISSEDHEITNPYGGRFPLSAFLAQYLIGRDAVAGDTSVRVADRMSVAGHGSVLTDVEELERFWTIVGLLESGNLARADIEIGAYKPKNEKLTLALFLGCVMITTLRVTDEISKRLAKDLSKELGQRVPHLVKELLNEHQSTLLEMREKRVVSIEALVDNTD